MTGKDILTAKQLLESGKCVAIPTETVYGLAANALDPTACAEIFRIKNRPSFNPLIVHVHAIGEIEKYVRAFPEPLKKLAEHFSPGPVTFVLPKKNNIPDIVTAGGDTVAVRIPAHPLTLELLRLLPFPLAAPSANPFGYISPVTAQHVEAQLGNEIPYILDGGACTVGLESTVVAYENNEVVILRLGGISVEAIEAVCGKVRLEINQSSDPKSPGQLAAHYAPRKKLYFGNLGDLLKTHAAAKKGILSFSKPVSGNNIAYQVILSEKGNMNEAAANLFAALRFLDNSDVDILLAEKFPEKDLGRAINDRLMRASFMGTDF